MPRRVPGAAVRDEGATEPVGLTPSQIQELRAALEKRRAELIADVEAKREEERGSGREVGDEMDEASNEGQAAMTSKLLERDVVLLGEIDRALGKIREGEYGLCEGTGEPIGFERLRLQPWARYSVAYQEELERQARARGA